MIQYLLASAIASFVPTSRVVATKPKPRAETVVKKAKLIPLTEVISKNLDVHRSTNKSLFAYDVTHQLKSPQQVMHSRTSLLLKLGFTPELFA